MVIIVALHAHAAAQFHVKGGRMQYCLQVLFLLSVCTGLLRCMIHSEYPSDWPKVLHDPSKGCINISGEYRNFGSEDHPSLADLLVKRWYGSKYFRKATHVVISQSEERIDVKVRKDDETLQDTTLLLGKDLLCKEGGLEFEKREWVGDVFAGFGTSQFIFRLSEDGSLILHATSSGAGMIFCILPLVASESKYYRFERYHP